MDVIKILEMESVNQDCIYLHREGPEWYAYEFSAFYLNSAFQVEHIEQFVDDVYEVKMVRIPLGKSPQEFFINKQLTEYGNDMVEVKCKLKYGGFSIWKSRFIH